MSETPSDPLCIVYWILKLRNRFLRVNFSDLCYPWVIFLWFSLSLGNFVISPAPWWESPFSLVDFEKERLWRRKWNFSPHSTFRKDIRMEIFRFKLINCEFTSCFIPRIFCVAEQCGRCKERKGTSDFHTGNEFFGFWTGVGEFLSNLVVLEGFLCLFWM